MNRCAAYEVPTLATKTVHLETNPAYDVPARTTRRVHLEKTNPIYENVISEQV